MRVGGDKGRGRGEEGGERREGWRGESGREGEMARCMGRGGVWREGEGVGLAEGL